MEHQRDAERGWGDWGPQCGRGFGQVGRPRNLLMKSAEGAGVDCGQTSPRASYMAAVAHPWEGLLWAGGRWPSSGEHGRGATCLTPTRQKCKHVGEAHSDRSNRDGNLGGTGCWRPREDLELGRLAVHRVKDGITHSKGGSEARGLGPNPSPVTAL